MKVGPLVPKGSVKDYQYPNNKDASYKHFEKLSLIHLQLPNILCLKAGIQI